MLVHLEKSFQEDLELFWINIGIEKIIEEQLVDFELEKLRSHIIKLATALYE